MQIFAHEKLLFFAFPSINYANATHHAAGSRRSHTQHVMHKQTHAHSQCVNAAGLGHVPGLQHSRLLYMTNTATGHGDTDASTGEVCLGGQCPAAAPRRALEPERLRSCGRKGREGPSRSCLALGHAGHSLGTGRAGRGRAGRGWRRAARGTRGTRGMRGMRGASCRGGSGTGRLIGTAESRGTRPGSCPARWA